MQLVGDDLFVTNVERLERGIDAGVANSILVKVNQIGTLTETLDTVGMATAPAYTVGDVAPLRARPRTSPSPTSPWPPTAARSRPARPARSDRVAKYNQLLRIETELGDTAAYLGRRRARRRRAAERA